MVAWNWRCRVRELTCCRLAKSMSEVGSAGFACNCFATANAAGAVGIFGGLARSSKSFMMSALSSDSPSMLREYSLIIRSDHTCPKCMRRVAPVIFIPGKLMGITTPVAPLSWPAAPELVIKAPAGAITRSPASTEIMRSGAFTIAVPLWHQKSVDVTVLVSAEEFISLWVDLPRIEHTLTMYLVWCRISISWHVVIINSSDVQRGKSATNWDCFTPLPPATCRSSHHFMRKNPLLFRHLGPLGFGISAARLGRNQTPHMRNARHHCEQEQ